MVARFALLALLCLNLTRCGKVLDDCNHLSDPDSGVSTAARSSLLDINELTDSDTEGHLYHYVGPKLNANMPSTTIHVYENIVRCSGL